MKRFAVAVLVIAAAGAVVTESLPAQGYRLRVDSRVQSVAYRGVELDSVPLTSLPPGRFVTADGFAVTCPQNFGYCYLFRPADERRGGPWTTTADLTLWGLGLPGLSLKSAARLGVDVGESQVWPGTRPAVELLEGYLEYAQRSFTVQAGRMHYSTRFGFSGFDGGKGVVRAFGGQLTGTVYGGWGLARGVPLPVTSPALNPLDDYQPRERHLMAGADVGWNITGFRGRLQYQREVDPRSDYFVSERWGFDLSLRPLAGVAIMGGADYDMANGLWGNVEAILGYTLPSGVVTAQVGGRRYRPHFPLWTIWGAFSPVAYGAVFGTATAQPIDGLSMTIRGEAYQFEESFAVVPLANVEDSGWRMGVSAVWEPVEQFVLDAGYHVDKGPGASSIGLEGGVTWRPTSDLSVGVNAASLIRPLEFRFSEADVWVLGLDVRYRVTPRLEVTGVMQRYGETRDRPDAAAFDWNQLRIQGGVRLLLGAGADRGALPPAIMRIPEGSRP